MTADPTRSEAVRRVLRRCALVLHPDAELKALADEMGVSPKVFRYWTDAGRVPARKAAWLERRFGAEIADASFLSAL